MLALALRELMQHLYQPVQHEKSSAIVPTLQSHRAGDMSFASHATREACSACACCRRRSLEALESSSNHTVCLAASLLLQQSFPLAGEEASVLAQQPVAKCLAFSGDGRLLALGGEDGSLTVLDWPTLRTRASLT